MKKASIFFGVALLCGIILFTNCQQTAVTSAKVYMQQTNWDKAIEQCQLAIEQKPNDAEAYFILGKAYGMKKMYREMNGAFKKSLESSPKRAQEIQNLRETNWVELFNGGVALIKQDKLDEAVEKFNLAIEILPDRIDAYKNLAYTYSQMNNDSLSIQTYLSAISIDSTDLELKNFLGILYYRNKKYEKAINILSEVIAKADPGSKEYSEALYHLAYSYDMLGQPEKALEAYNKALEAVPDDKDIMFNLGRLYFMMDNFEKAIENFQKVIKVDSSDFEAHLNTGNAYLQLEKFKEAVPYFERATELKPDNANAWNNLGVAYVRAGMVEEGTAAFNKAEELRPAQ